MRCTCDYENPKIEHGLEWYTSRAKLGDGRYVEVVTVDVMDEELIDKNSDLTSITLFSADGTIQYQISGCDYITKKYGPIVQESICEEQGQYAKAFLEDYGVL